MARKTEPPMVYVAPLDVPDLPPEYKATVALSRRDGAPLTPAEFAALEARYPWPRKATAKRTAAPKRPGKASAARRKPSPKRRAAKPAPRRR